MPEVLAFSICSSATFYWGYATQAAHRALTPYSGLLSERSVRTKMERKVQNSRRKSSTYDIVWYIQMLFYTSSTHNCTCRSKELFSGQTRFSEKLLAVTFAPWIPIEVKHWLSVLEVLQLRPKLVMSLLGTVPFWIAITVIHHSVWTEQCWKELSFSYSVSHIFPSGDQSCRILSIFAISGEWLSGITMTLSSCTLCVLITCISSEYQHHNFGNPIVLNKPWPLECRRQTTGRYTSTIHISFLSYKSQDQCLPLCWVCTQHDNNIS